MLIFCIVLNISIIIRHIVLLYFYMSYNEGSKTIGYLKPNKKFTKNVN